MLLDALSAAADEITRELAPGSVELRLRGRRARLRRDAGADRRGGRAGARRRRTPAPPEADEGATARINLRLPEQLKAGIEQAAGRERLSVNAWLVRAAAAALARRRPPPAAAWRRGSARATPAGCADRASVRSEITPMSSTLT